MPMYILLSTLTPEGRKTIQKKAEGIRDVNKEIEAFGAKVVAQHSTQFWDPTTLLTSLKL
jgi:uncharacterized protein with GYD domain